MAKRTHTIPLTFGLRNWHASLAILSGVFLACLGCDKIIIIGKNNTKSVLDTCRKWPIAPKRVHRHLTIFTLPGSYVRIHIAFKSVSLSVLLSTQLNVFCRFGFIQDLLVIFWMLISLGQMLLINFNIGHLLTLTLWPMMTLKGMVFH